MTPLLDTGIYLRLFKGEALARRGVDDAPDVTFGPFSFIHACGETLEATTDDGEEFLLHVVGRGVYYDGAIYADRLFFAGRPEAVTPFDPEKAHPQRRRED